jgi:hypothetical protein
MSSALTRELVYCKETSNELACGKVLQYGWLPKISQAHG